MSKKKQAHDLLIDRERIRGASRMIPEGTEASAVTAEQIETIRNDILTFLQHYEVSKKTMAKSAGIGHSTLSEFLTGNYKGNNAQMAINLEMWLVEEEQRRAQPKTTKFVQTNVVMHIHSIVKWCLDYRKIGLIYSPESTGIGKTNALQFIHQHIGPRRSSLATIDKVDANPTGLLAKLCQAMHIDDSGSIKVKFARLEVALKGKSHILLIDQIQNLRWSKDDKPFYILCDLYDSTKTAQMWCGTADLVGYLNRQRTRQHDESLAQIRRRIFPRVNLMDMLKTGGPDGKGQPLVSYDQMQEIFSPNKLKLTHSAMRTLFKITNSADTGGLGFCVQLIEWANVYASIYGLKSIDDSLLKSAMALGITSAQTETLLNDVKEYDQQVARTA